MKRCFVVLVLTLIGCDSHEPIATDGALIQIDFERSLGNLGRAATSGQSHDGEPEFKRGKNGEALYSLGDGRWVEFETAETISISDTVEISFDFRRADWVNPYKNGSGTQTVAVISSVSPTKISHISFNIANGSSPNLQIAFEDTGGKKHRLRSEQGLVENDWHNVRLRINKQAKETLLYLDGERIDRIKAVPTVIHNGIDRIKFGTWYKKNQAYRGEIDNFLILDPNTP